MTRSGPRAAAAQIDATLGSFKASVDADTVAVLDRLARHRAPAREEPGRWRIRGMHDQRLPLPGSRLASAFKARTCSHSVTATVVCRYGAHFVTGV